MVFHLCVATWLGAVFCCFFRGRLGQQVGEAILASKESLQLFSLAGRYVLVDVFADSADSPSCSENAYEHPWFFFAGLRVFTPG